MKTRFTQEQIESVHEALLATNYYTDAYLRKEKRTLTAVKCPLCNEPLIFSQKSLSYSMECLTDGIVFTLHGF